MALLPSKSLFFSSLWLDTTDSTRRPLVYSWNEFHGRAFPRVAVYCPKRIDHSLASFGRVAGHLIRSASPSQDDPCQTLRRSPFPIGTEYEALVAGTPTALDAIPGAVYICDQEGWLVRYNTEAAASGVGSPTWPAPKSDYAAPTVYFCWMALLSPTPNAQWLKRRGPARTLETLK
jgi:hypothetical protein